MTYYDTYVASADKELLLGFLSSFVNYIQPQQGRPATDATEDIPAQEAAGDPALWYSCVRATAPIDAMVPEGILAIGADDGSKVVGVWA